MNQRLWIVLTLALAIASGASYAVYRLAAPVRNMAKPIPAVQLVVAARDLSVGALVRDGDLKIANWMGPVPQGSVARKSLALNRGVVAPIYLNEPVTENRLAAAGSGGGLAATIPTGMRACAVRVNEVVGVAGFVIPGMRVDVLMTGIPPGETTAAVPAVKTLLQNIEVLSAGTNFEKDKEGKPQQTPVVNLLVNPRDAEILSLAGNETKIQLILRNPMDTQVTKPSGTSMSELFGVPKPKAPRTSDAEAAVPVPAVIPKVAPRVDLSNLETIEVQNGAVHTTARFRSQEAQ
jgi:pilus assembly protein CpaB